MRFDLIFSFKKLSGGVGLQVCQIAVWVYAFKTCIMTGTLHIKTSAVVNLTSCSESCN
jgi:hypothetical protein